MVVAAVVVVGGVGGENGRDKYLASFSLRYCVQGNEMHARSSADAYRHREPRKFTSDGSLRARRMCAVLGVLSVGKCTEDIFVSMRRLVEPQERRR